MCSDGALSFAVPGMTTDSFYHLYMLRNVIIHDSLREAVQRLQNKFKCFHWPTFSVSVDSEPESRGHMSMEMLLALLLEDSAMESDKLRPVTAMTTYLYIPKLSRHQRAIMLMNLGAYASVMCGWFGALREPTLSDVVRILTKLDAEECEKLTCGDQLEPAFNRFTMAVGWNIAGDVIRKEVQNYFVDSCVVPSLSVSIHALMNLHKRVLYRVLSWMASRVPCCGQGPILKGILNELKPYLTQCLLNIVKFCGEIRNPAEAVALEPVDMSIVLELIRERSRDDPGTCTAQELDSGDDAEEEPASKRRRKSSDSSLSPPVPPKCSSTSKRPIASSSTQPQPSSVGPLGSTNISKNPSGKGDDDEEVKKARAKINRQLVVRQWRQQIRHTAEYIRENYGYDFHALRLYMLGKPVDSNRFDRDDPDSELEDAKTESDMYGNAASLPARRSRFGNDKVAPTLDVDLQILYYHITSWVLVPGYNGNGPHDESLLYDGDNAWIERFIVSNKTLFAKHLSDCEESQSFSDHWKMILMIEIHYYIKESLSKMFPDLLTNPNAVHDAFVNRMVKPYETRVRMQSNSQLVTNFHVKALGHQFAMKDLEKFTGMTMCIGYFSDDTSREKPRPPSRLMLFTCRCIVYDVEDAEDLSDARKLDTALLKMIGNRGMMKQWTPRVGDKLHLFPFESLVTFHRGFKALHGVDELPFSFKKYLFGATIPQLISTGSGPYQQREVTGPHTDMEAVRRGVDAGCLLYMDKLTATQCDESQRRALLVALREIGKMEDNFRTSLSVIQGPPGTGKSVTICNFIAALLHHSQAGHFIEGVNHKSVLRKPSSMIPFSSNRSGMRILVCCSSNNGVNNITRKMLEMGVVSGDGDKVTPSLVRVGRHQYNYEDLDSVSLPKLALQYDNQLHHPDECLFRTHPSSRARASLAEETMIFFMTCSTAGSSVLKDLKVSFDVVIIDEAAQCSEVEALVPIVAATARGKNARLNVVLAGDHKQLPPVFTSVHHVKKFFRENPKFSAGFMYKDVTKSLFERMFVDRRAPQSALMKQYRAQPDMSSILTRHVYGSMVSHPTDRTPYMFNFNDPSRSPGAFHPLTFIGTCNSRLRYETRRKGMKGHFVNLFEAQIVDTVLRKLWKIVDDENYLRGSIFVTSPYHSQVDLLKSHLEGRGGFLSSRNFRNDLDVLVSTVDSLQGMERGIVILSLTRSNDFENVGFLNDDRRINVATSRAKFLLIIVGCSETLRYCSMINHVYKACARNAPGANAVTACTYVPDEVMQGDRSEMHLS